MSSRSRMAFACCTRSNTGYLGAKEYIIESTIYYIVDSSLIVGRFGRVSALKVAHLIKRHLQYWTASKVAAVWQWL